MPMPIPIGTTSGRKVSLSAARRETHMHIIGATGQGKSKFIEHCIREDILAGHGVCLIDPEGDLYTAIVKWCAKHKVDRFKNIHLFDPTEPDWRFRFNPLYVHPGEKSNHRISTVIEALAQVWGGEDSRSTPAIRTTLKAIFTLLVNHGYSLAEAFYLTSTNDPYSIVSQLTDTIDDPIIAEIWDGYQLSAEKTPREHQAEFGGTRRRLLELLDDEETREIFSSYESPIDFKTCMENGDVILINLSPHALGDDRARAFGALFVRELFFSASRRDPAEAKNNPFYAYIDECGDFLTNDITRILARSRKRGLHVILAHQWLEQLRERGTGIYQGVMGVQDKVVFGGVSDEDAVILADQLFRTEYDLELPVQSLVKPTVVRYQRTWLQNWSEADGDVEAFGETVGIAEGVSSGSSQLESYSTPLYDAFGFPSSEDAGTQNTGRGNSNMTTRNESNVASKSRGHVSSTSTGASEALEPVLEDLPSSVHSLENIRHMAVKRLRSIPKRNAVVKGANNPSFDIATYDVESVDVDEATVTRFKQRVLENSRYTLPTQEVRLSLEARYNKLISFRAAEGTQPVVLDRNTDLLS